MKTIKNNEENGVLYDGIVEVDGISGKDELMTKEMMLEYFKGHFREKGFKKNKQTWYKDDGTLIYMFNVQNSQFGKSLFYFNIGLIFSSNGLSLPLSDWNCWARIRYGKNIEDTFASFLAWFEKYNSLEKIQKESKKPYLTLTDPRWRIRGYFDKEK